MQRGLIAQIENEHDVEYRTRLEAQIAAEAGVPVDELRAALARVHWDGMYGPVSDEDWENMAPEGQPALSNHRAQAVLKEALAAPVEDFIIEDLVPVACGDSEEWEVVEMGRIDGDAIRKEFFWKVIQVYGGIPAF